jgi:hypothetical protein
VKYFYQYGNVLLPQKWKFSAFITREEKLSMWMQIFQIISSGHFLRTNPEARRVRIEGEVPS